MKIKCQSCGQKLEGTESVCTNCGATVKYFCHYCGKQLDNGKNKYCPLCKQQKREKSKGVVSTVGSVALAVLATGFTVVKKIGGGKA